MGIVLDSIYVTTYRELKRFVRSRSRIIGSIVNPIIWMVFFGLGFSRALSVPGIAALFGGVGYMQFLAPGIIAMAVFTASLISGITLIFDKQFGFFKEVLIAPAPRWSALFGRILGDSIAAVLQGAMMLAIVFLIVPGLSLLEA
ncbi:MAG: ABC transporter permease [Pyrodictiaceae archaeon]